MASGSALLRQSLTRAGSIFLSSSYLCTGAAHYSDESAREFMDPFRLARLKSLSRHQLRSDPDSTGTGPDKIGSSKLIDPA